LSTGAAYSRVLGVPTGTNIEDSSLASMEAMQWVLLYLSIGHDIENISHSTVKCAGAPSCMYSILALTASGASFDACHTIRNYPDIFERMRRSMVRRVEA
jgi:hypothetical protein